MDPLLPVPITATVELTEVGWGTQVDLVCAYAPAAAEQPYPYALVVTDGAGETQQIGTWTALPGQRRRPHRRHGLDPRPDRHGRGAHAERDGGAAAGRDVRTSARREALRVELVGDAAHHRHVPVGVVVAEQRPRLPGAPSPPPLAHR